MPMHHGRYMRPLTDKQARILLLVGTHIHRLGYAPTLEELRVVVGTSRHTVYEHIENLVAKGYIIKSPAIERGLILTEDGEHWVIDRQKHADSITAL